MDSADSALIVTLYVSFRVDHGFDQPGLSGGDRGGQGDVQGRFILDASGLEAKAAGDGREVCVRGEGGAVAGEAPTVLLQLDHVERPVIEDDNNDGEMLSHRCFEVAQAHEQWTIPAVHDGSRCAGPQHAFEFQVSFAVLGQPIPACLTTCGLVGGEVPLGGYYPPVGDDCIGVEMLRVIGSSLAVIMQSHGVFTIGDSPAEATRVAVEVEEIAKITHLAMLRGTPIRLTDEQVAVMVRNYNENYGQANRAR